MYTHRGAYLQSVAMAFHSGMDLNSVYLWTLPMFHCNGWCFTGAVTAAGATHVCLPRVEADAIWEVIDDAGVTHMCAAPTVISTITSAPSATISLRKVWVATGGVPPAPALLARARTRGLDVTHLYSMTETYGPAVINEWDRVWDAAPEAERDRLNSSGDLRAHLLDRLAKFKVPDRIEFATLPTTATGKIQKFQLEQQLIAHPPG